MTSPGGILHKLVTVTAPTNDYRRQQPTSATSVTATDHDVVIQRDGQQRGPSRLPRPLGGASSRCLHPVKRLKFFPAERPTDPVCADSHVRAEAR